MSVKPLKTSFSIKGTPFPFSMMRPVTIIIIRTASNPTPIAKNEFIPAISVRNNAKIEPTNKSIPLS